MLNSVNLDICGKQQWWKFKTCVLQNKTMLDNVKTFNKGLGAKTSLRAGKNILTFFQEISLRTVILEIDIL